MDAKKTGEFIRTLRMEKNLTQKELAEGLHVSTQAVSKWERGLGMPDISLLEPLAEALGVSVAELLAGEWSEAAAQAEEPVRTVLQMVREKLRRKNVQMGLLVGLLAAVFLLAAQLYQPVMPGGILGGEYTAVEVVYTDLLSSFYYGDGFRETYVFASNVPKDDGSGEFENQVTVTNEFGSGTYPITWASKEVGNTGIWTGPESGKAERTAVPSAMGTGKLYRLSEITKETRYVFYQRGGNLFSVEYNSSGRVEKVARLAQGSPAREPVRLSTMQVVSTQLSRDAETAVRALEDKMDTSYFTFRVTADIQRYIVRGYGYENGAWAKWVEGEASVNGNKTQTIVLRQGRTELLAGKMDGSNVLFGIYSHGGPIFDGEGIAFSDSVEEPETLKAGEELPLWAAWFSRNKAWETGSGFTLSAPFQTDPDLDAGVVFTLECLP